MLNGDTGPMVDGVGEAVVWQACRRTTTQLFPDLLVTGADSCETAQGGVVASLQGIRGFWRAAWRGRSFPTPGKDARISASCCFSALARPPCPAGMRAGGQAVDPAMGVFDLTVEQAAAP